jgi:arylsulfatase A-like enzyme
VRGPGIGPGSRREHFALNIDITPTIVELSGITAERAMDGRSLVPLLGSTPLTPDRWRRDFLVEIYMPLQQVRGVRSEAWMYVELTPSGERQLYDLRTDPYQLNSLHDSAPPELIQQLASRLDELATCGGGTCQR